jgi:hypothetical protein
MEGLRCIDDFTMKCLDREHRAYFNTLYAGTTQVIIDLCQEGDYQKGKERDRYNEQRSNKISFFVYLKVHELKKYDELHNVSA